MIEYIKYCKKEHNIPLGCNTIQLGTLKYYREMDPRFSIADINEQTETTIINSFDSSIADQKTMNQFSSIKVDNKSRIIAENSVQVIEFQNSYIFSMSINNKENIIYFDQARKIDINYDSYYKIRKIPLFVNRLENIIIQNLQNNWFDETKFGRKIEEIDLINIKLMSIFKPVTYVDSKTVEIVDSKIINSPYHNRIIDRIVFTKEKVHIDDNELRILFLFVLSNKDIIPVKKEPIILSKNKLGKFLIYP
jgi:hypothetical protein